MQNCAILAHQTSSAVGWAILNPSGQLGQHRLSLARIAVCHLLHDARNDTAFIAIILASLLAIDNNTTFLCNITTESTGAYNQAAALSFAAHSQQS